MEKTAGKSEERTLQHQKERITSGWLCKKLLACCLSDCAAKIFFSAAVSQILWRRRRQNSFHPPTLFRLSDTFWRPHKRAGKFTDRNPFIFMKQSKLFVYLESFSSREQEKFRQFVLSPYINQHLKTRELLEIALEQSRDGAHQYSPREIFKILHPDEPFSEQKLHNYLSSLKKLFLKFLAYEAFERQNYMEDLLVLEEANRRNLFDLFGNRVKQLEKQLEASPFRDEQYSYALYRINVQLGYHTGTFGRRAKTNVTLQKMMDHLDRFYLIEKLRHACHLTAHSILLNVQYDLGFLPHILEVIEKKPERYTADPTIDAYYTILHTLRYEREESYYLHLKSLLSKHFDELSSNAQIDLYRFANNYCIRKLNTGNNAYQEELFDLFKQALEKGLLLENGFISEWDYKNISTLGCSLKAFEWTEIFLEDFKDKLPDNCRENAYTFNLANLYYHKKMFGKVRETLLKVQFTDVKYHLNTAFLLLRTYFAEDDTEALYNLLDTLRIYILRNRQITTDEKKGYNNFLNFARKLVNYRSQDGIYYTRQPMSEKITALRTKIENTPNVTHKNWLLEQCRTNLQPAM